MLDVTTGHKHGLLTADLNLRVLAAASAFASKEETRYYLNGVFLEIDERGITYAATDGHRLIAYRDDLHLADAKNLFTGCYIIPTERCKFFKLKKDDDSYAKIFSNGSRLTIAYGLVDITFFPIDGIFPDWRKVVPKKPVSGALTQFDLTQLATFQKFADVLELPKPFVAGNGGDAPSYIWFPAHPEIVGLQMPYRLSDELGREAPQWTRVGPEREQGDIEDVLNAVTDKVKNAATDPDFKKMGKSVPLTEEEKAQGMSAAFVDKKGNRTTIGATEAKH